MLYVLWITKQKVMNCLLLSKMYNKDAVSMGTRGAVHFCIAVTGLDHFHIRVCVVL
jgi:hypothetical protein